MPSTARAETVGSLLRPRHVFDSRAEVREGKKTPAELKALEDAAILEAIKLQTEVGLDVITDGEFRRQGWNPATSFLPDAPIEGYQSADDYRITYMKFWRDETGTMLTAPLAPARSSRAR